MGGRPEYPEKNLSEQGENQQQTQPTYGAGSGNQTRATLVGEGGRGWEEDRSTRRKTSRSKDRTNNKLNPHMAPGPGIEPGPHWWEASALITAPPLLPVYPTSRPLLAPPVDYPPPLLTGPRPPVSPPPPPHLPS